MNKHLFSLRPSAYLCVLCVEIALNRRGRRDTQRTAEETVNKERCYGTHA